MTEKGKNIVTLITISGLVTAAVLSFVVYQKVSESNNNPDPSDVPIIVGSGTPEKYQGTNGWYFVDKTSWNVYKKEKSSWKAEGVLYELEKQHISGSTIIDADGLFALYSNTMKKSYNYEATLKDWVSDLKEKRMYNYVEYTVSFINSDSRTTKLADQKARLRETITYRNPLPYKEANETSVFTFSSWDHSLRSVYESFTTTAQYQAIPISSVFKTNADGESYNATIPADLKGSIHSIAIPDNINGKPVTEIGYEAFRDCTSLETVILPESLTTIGGWAFYGCSSLRTLYIPKNVTEIAPTAFGWGCNAIEKFEIDPNNTTFTVLDDILYTIDLKEIVRYPSGKVATYPDRTYVLKDSIEKIWTFAFCGMKNVDHIVLSNSTKEIGSWAFGASSIIDFNFTRMVAKIGTDPFGACAELTKYTVDSENYNFKAVDGVLYSYDLETIIRYPIKSLSTKYEILEGTKSVGSYAFNSCNLYEINVPSTVTSFLYGAFSESSNLQYINLPNSLTTIEGDCFLQCFSLADVFVPISVITIGDYALSYIGTSIVSCEATSKPLGWSDKWCTTQTIIWGVSK